jgi:hypothetical protein
METNRKKTLGYILFWLGIVLALVLTTLTTWASIEAVFYGFISYSKVPLKGVSCPPLMTRSEKAVITASVKNPSDKPISFLIQADISTRGVARSERMNPVLEPGETRKFEWSLSSSDVDLNHFIFARVYRYSTYLWELAEATCGVFVLDIPFLTGRQIFWGGALLGLGCIALGLWLTRQPFRPVQQGSTANFDTARKFLAVIVVIGLLAGVMRSWLLGVLVLVVAVLLLAMFLLSMIDRQ